MIAKSKHLLIALALFVGGPIELFAQGTAATDQGRLNAGGAPAKGLYDFQFKPHFHPLVNNQIGDPFFTNATMVDFDPGAFAGSNGWLEVDQCTNGAGSYTLLSPLQAASSQPGGSGTNVLVPNPSGDASRFGTLAQGSDRADEESLQPIDAITQCNDITEPGVQHVGPMANEDDKHITAADEGRVALVAIQGLNQNTASEAKNKDAELAELSQTVNQLMEEIKVVNQKLNEDNK